MSLLLTYLKDGQPVHLSALDAIDPWIRQPSAPFWLDLASPTEEELDLLGRAFNFHTLTMEDLRGENPRPKLEDYPGHVFLVLHSAMVKARELELVEVHAFVSEHYVITSHAGKFEEYEGFQHRIEERALWLRRGPGFCLYRIMDNLADGYLAVVNTIDDELDRTQDSILAEGGLRAIEPIVMIRRHLATLRRVVSPTREIASELSLHQYSFVGRETSVYFRDVHNLLVAIFDMTETQRDVASNLLDAHLSAISNRLNEVMKRLTIVATIFLPISFIASFGGMNFSALPFDNPVFFIFIIASLLAVPLLMILWFRREGWF